MAEAKKQEVRLVAEADEGFAFRIVDPETGTGNDPRRS